MLDITRNLQRVITNYECFSRGLDRLPEAEVQVRNIRRRRESEISADVTVVYNDLGTKKTFRNCKYKLDEVVA